MVAEVFFEFRDPGISMGNVIQLWEISLEDPRFIHNDWEGWKSTMAIGE